MSSANLSKAAQKLRYIGNLPKLTLEPCRYSNRKGSPLLSLPAELFIGFLGFFEMRFLLSAVWTTCKLFYGFFKDLSGKYYLANRIFSKVTSLSSIAKLYILSPVDNLQIHFQPNIDRLPEGISRPTGIRFTTFLKASLEKNSSNSVRSMIIFTSKVTNPSDKPFLSGLALLISSPSLSNNSQFLELPSMVIDDSIMKLLEDLKKPSDWVYFMECCFKLDFPNEFVSKKLHPILNPFFASFPSSIDSRFFLPCNLEEFFCHFLGMFPSTYKRTLDFSFSMSEMV